MPLCFNGALLPPPTLEYVAWVDVMGIQSAMARSVDIAANFIFKLHSAALQAPQASVRLYPIMDGFYAATDQQAAIESFLASVYAAAADEFIQASNPLHRFMIRGALAFGPVIHGQNVPPAVANVFQATAGHTHKDAILLGLPMVQAHEFERSAPPFGLFVHESARTFAPAGAQPFHHVWWRWAQPQYATIWQRLPAALQSHLDWCKKRPHLLLYEADRIAAHEALSAEYFA